MFDCALSLFEVDALFFTVDRFCSWFTPCCIKGSFHAILTDCRFLPAFVMRTQERKAIFLRPSSNIPSCGRLSLFLVLESEIFLFQFFFAPGRACCFIGFAS